MNSSSMFSPTRKRRKRQWDKRGAGAASGISRKVVMDDRLSKMDESDR